MGLSKAPVNLLVEGLYTDGYQHTGNCCLTNGNRDQWYGGYFGVMIHLFWSNRATLAYPTSIEGRERMALGLEMFGQHPIIFA